VLSWGRNYRDELGDGSTTNRTRPVQVTGVSTAVSIGAGRDHGVAVMADGSVRTWGYNVNGQLGDGTTTSRSRAVPVPGVTGATKAGGGGGEYSVVLVGTVPTENRAPTASFSNTCTGLSCSFDGRGSTDPDGTVTGYSWDFGDQSAAESVPVVSHAFPAAGVYQVGLTVTDDDGATGQVTQEVKVTDAPPPPTPPAFRAAAASDVNTSKPVVTVPAAVQSGDQLLLFVSTNRNATATTPAGWTLRGTVADGTDVRSWVFTRVAADGTAGSRVQVTLDAISKSDITVSAYSAAGPASAPVGANEPGSTAQHRSPAATVAADGSMVVSYWADKASATHGWTLPATLTRRTMTTTGSGAGTLTSTSGDISGVSAGTWPGATANAGTVSSKAIAWTVVLPPA
jgi:PKD repeat protein